MENKIKHLELIQNIIDRQSRNSFLLKGWVITLFAALLVLPLKNGEVDKSILIYFLISVFWILDSYYLWKEREFRCLYKVVASSREKEIDFNMNANKAAKKYKCTWINTFFSKPSFVFYSALLIFSYIFFNWG